MCVCVCACVRCISNYLEIIILCRRRKNIDFSNNECLKFEKFHKFIHEFIRETEFKIINTGHCLTDDEISQIFFIYVNKNVMKI